jgi:hypothetical protein
MARGNSAATHRGNSQVAAVQLTAWKVGTQTPKVKLVSCRIGHSELHIFDRRLSDIDT